ncbi:MAG: hypothetical protein ABSB42_04605 [Tepidisphaeraceae bacterium]|jgi:hypothetical protein
MDDREDGIEIGAHQVDGGYWPIYLTGKEIINKIFGDDVGVPITGVTLRAKTDDGKVVRVQIANGDSTTVIAQIE